jgi:hypothetical protein
MSRSSAALERSISDQSPDAPASVDRAGESLNRDAISVREWPAAEALIHAELPWILTGLAALAFGFAIGLKASPAGFSIFGMGHPKSVDVWASVGSQIPHSRPI